MVIFENEMDTKESSQALEMSYILICMAVTSVERHWSVDLKFVYFKLYFKKEQEKKL